MLVGIWLVGSLLFLLRPVIGFLQTRRLKRTADYTVPHWLRSKCDELVTVLGIRKRVRIAVSEDINVPAALGLLQPLVLLPTSAVSGMTL